MSYVCGSFTLYSKLYGLAGYSGSYDLYGAGAEYEGAEYEGAEYDGAEYDGAEYDGADLYAGLYDGAGL